MPKPSPTFVSKRFKPISKCRGTDCPLKGDCLRYLFPIATGKGIWQPHLKEMPFKVYHGEVTCEKFLDARQADITSYLR